MNGFFHYFLSALDPMANLGFSRAFVALMFSELPYWWLFALSFVLMVLPAIIVWLVYLVNPALIRPPLPVRPRQVEPLVSVVIAGRNESATIGQCIRAALLCGYSWMTTRKTTVWRSPGAPLSVSRATAGMQTGCGSSRRHAAMARRALSISASAWREASSSRSPTPIR